jgi:16S rRNA G1207 methylase RsmC
MFATENQFFPSTKDLARKVYYEANIKDKQSVLDPTAGNGVLLDIVAEYRNKWDRVERYAIEIDQELRFILQGKEHKVIGTNFLTYCEPMEFDRIIMNPPFRIGAEMVLKAWSHLKAGGRLVAILNTETLGNAYSGDRKALANLIKPIRIITRTRASF